MPLRATKSKDSSFENGYQRNDRGIISNEHALSLSSRFPARDQRAQNSRADRCSHCPDLLCGVVTRLDPTCLRRVSLANSPGHGGKQRIQFMCCSRSKTGVARWRVTLRSTNGVISCEVVRSSFSGVVLISPRPSGVPWYLVHPAIRNRITSRQTATACYSSPQAILNANGNRQVNCNPNE